MKTKADTSLSLLQIFQLTDVVLPPLSVCTVCGWVVGGGGGGGGGSSNSSSSRSSSVILLRPGRERKM